MPQSQVVTGSKKAVSRSSDEPLPSRMAAGQVPNSPLAEMMSRPPQVMRSLSKSWDSNILPPVLKQQQGGKAMHMSVDVSGSAGTPGCSTSQLDDVNWACMEAAATEAILQQQRRLARSTPAVASTSAPSIQAPAAATTTATTAAASTITASTITVAAPRASSYNADAQLRLHDMSLQRLQELMDQSAAVAASASGATASAAAAAVAASTEHARAVLHTNAVRQAGSPAWDQPPPPPPPRQSAQTAALVLPLLTAAPLVREGEVTCSMSWDTWTPTISSSGQRGHHFHGAHGSSGGAKHPGGNPKHHYNIAYRFAGPVERKVQQMLEFVRHNEDAMSELEARLAAYRAADEPARAAREALVRSTQEAAVSSTAESRVARLKELGEQRDERAKLVREQQKQREEEALRAKVMAAQRDELRRARKQQEFAAQAAAAQRLMQASVWGGLVRAVHTTQLLVTAAVALNRQEQMGAKEQACITIQRFWRGYLQRRYFRRCMKALVVLQRAMKQRYGDDFTNRQRREAAANTVVLFLKQMEGTSHLQVILKRMRMKAARERRHFKQLDILRTAQRALVVSQWAALEERMLALSRRRAGKDSATGAGAKAGGPKKSRLAGTVEARKAGAQAAARAGVADPAEEVAGAGGGNVPQGPLPGQCHANDRLLLESLEATPMELKGLITQVYLKMKRRAYIAVVGLHWRDVARYRRQKRQQDGIAMAMSILKDANAAAVPGRGAKKASVTGIDAGIEVEKESNVFMTVASASAAGAGRLPVQLRFRPTATLPELRILLQQAASEYPSFMAFLKRQDADQYRTQLLAELAQRRLALPMDASTSEPESSTETSRRQSRISMTGNESAPIARGISLNANTDATAAAISASTAAAMQAQAQAQVAAAAATKETWAQAMLRRMESCLRKRLQMSSVQLSSCLQSPPTRSSDWDDDTLMMLMYAGAAGAGVGRSSPIRE